MHQVRAPVDHRLNPYRLRSLRQNHTPRMAMNEPKAIRVSASVTSTDPETIHRTIETLARAASGLALEGADVYLIIGPDPEDDDDDTADT